MARLRCVVGLILLGLALVIGVAFGVAAAHEPRPVVVDLGGPMLGVGACLIFAVSSLPLLVPQRERPTDPRRNRWYIAFGLWATLLPITGMGYDPDDYTTLARSTDGERRVVLYKQEGCLRVWAGTGVAATVTGEIGAADLVNEAFFRDGDTVVLTWEGSLYPSLPRASPTVIRLDPRSGRPLDHTRRSCESPSHTAAPPADRSGHRHPATHPPT